MNKIYTYNLSLMLLLLFVLDASAESNLVRILSTPINISFNPAKAYFIVASDDKQVSIVPAEIVALRSNGNSQSTAEYMAAAAIDVPETFENCSYSLVVDGNKELIRSDAQRVSIAPQDDEDRSKLEKAVAKARSNNITLKQTVRTLDSELRRLRSDVDVIADIGRIVVLREERIRLEGMLLSIDQEERTLKESLALIRARGTPPGYVGQEAQLTKVLAEYSGMLVKSKKKAIHNGASQ